MKRVYSKPTIHVEVMELDMPIASSCGSYDDSYELREQGWFVSDDSCDFITDWMNDLGMTGDTLCYHSNVRTNLSS